MEINEIHFFHGFLGSPEDWKEVVENLNLSSEIEIFQHHLTSDYIRLGKSASFNTWVELKEKEMDPGRKRVLVGYSLGGRLAMHLSPSLYQSMFLIGSHPGLDEGREERKKSDFSWFRRLTSVGAEKWLEEWNQQEVFKNDKVRPSRQFSNEELQVQVDLMQAWSLANQIDRRGFLLENFKKFYWACGANDEKFIRVKLEMEGILPRTNVCEIEDSGHGCLFDNPKAVAQWIESGVSGAR